MGLRQKHDPVSKLCPKPELQAIRSANRKLVGKCHFLPSIVKWLQVKKKKTDSILIVLPSCPFFPPPSPLYHAIAYFLLFTLFLAHFLHLPPVTPDPPP